MCLGGRVKLPREGNKCAWFKRKNRWVPSREGGKRIPGRRNSICKVLQGHEAGDVGWSQNIVLFASLKKTGLDPGDKRKSKELIWVKVANEAHVIHGVCSYHASSSFPSIPTPLNTHTTRSSVISSNSYRYFSLFSLTRENPRAGAFYFFFTCLS